MYTVPSVGNSVNHDLSAGCGHLYVVPVIRFAACRISFRGGGAELLQKPTAAATLYRTTHATKCFALRVSPVMFLSVTSHKAAIIHLQVTTKFAHSIPPAAPLLEPTIPCQACFESTLGNCLTQDGNVCHGWLSTLNC
jgi:hypothetical protein